MNKFNKTMFIVGITMCLVVLIISACMPPEAMEELETASQSDSQSNFASYQIHFPDGTAKNICATSIRVDSNAMVTFYKGSELIFRIYGESVWFTSEPSEYCGY
jgi:hypothetical protein